MASTKRRIFISCAYSDRNRAKGFNLLRWNKNVPLGFVGRHLLDPVDSTDNKYISTKINEQLKGTSVTVALLGKHTADRPWVRREIERSLERGNGVLGIRLEPGVRVPKALQDSGAEILDWKPKLFQAAIERAYGAARRTVAIAAATGQAGSGCGR